MTPHPEQYDFIWLVKNQSFLFSSFWANIEYPKYHFLATYDKGDHKLYLLKTDRLRLANIGYKKYTTGYSAYIRHTLNSLRIQKKYLRLIKRKNIKLLSNKGLADFFEEVSSRILGIWSAYFFTEYFCLDKVEIEINSQGKNYKKLVRHVHEIQKIKLAIRHILNITWFENKKNILRPIYGLIAKRLGKKDLSSYNYLELIGALRGHTLPLVDRRTHVWGKFNGWKPVTGRRASGIIRKFNLYFLQNRSLTGQIARPGFYRGKVIIIPFDLKGDYRNKMARMKKGQVLVTGSTGPEMILACKKAGAIVTEEGGITSHAAIISRELGIPCIIGTKIATQVLKDGDIVVVDATKGIVKKINE